MSFEAFAVSTGVVALGEMGDKTQLLALMLAARWRRPLPIIAGILVATLANHALAGWFGSLVTGWVHPEVLRWGVVLLLTLIWIGALAMMAGGAVSLFDRRLRIGAPSRRPRLAAANARPEAA